MKRPASGPHRKLKKATAGRKPPSPKAGPIAAANGLGEAAKGKKCLPIGSTEQARSHMAESTTAQVESSSDPRSVLKSLIPTAISLYARALGGEPTTGAQQKMAESILKSAGLLDEGGLIEVSDVILVEFVPIQMDRAGIVHTIPAAPVKRPMLNENPVPAGAVANRGL